VKDVIIQSFTNKVEFIVFTINGENPNENTEVSEGAGRK
jgi:hypothetical protein